MIASDRPQTLHERAVQAYLQGGMWTVHAGIGITSGMVVGTALQILLQSGDMSGWVFKAGIALVCTSLLVQAGFQATKARLSRAAARVTRPTRTNATWHRRQGTVFAETDRGDTANPFTGPGLRGETTRRKAHTAAEEPIDVEWEDIPDVQPSARTRTEQDAMRKAIDDARREADEEKLLLLRELDLKRMPVSTTELKNAWKTRMRAVHPDMGVKPSLEAAKRANAAYKRLQSLLS